MAQGISAPSVIEIHLLGPFRVRVDGAAVEEQTWARRKPTLLVKLLALQPHHQLHREQVTELLWPEQESESANNNLHKAIHMARRALEPDLDSAAGSHFILTRGQQIVLSAPGKLWVDAEAFERAASEVVRGEEVEAYETALALYGGELLPEDLYEDWAASRREQLRAQHQSLLMKLALLHQARGEYERSIERFKELLACDPAKEEAHRRLMRLYASTGDKQQAFRQYQLCHETLRRELDAEPDEATVKLHEEIASGQIQPLSLSRPQPSRQDAPNISSLAILPLANASDDPGMEYLSDGITESIINNLSQLPQLKVMARSTVFNYKGREVDPRKVGRDLRVSAVLMGRVLQFGDALIIRTELIDVADGAQLWGEQYNRKLSDILVVQEEISREISEKLRLKLTKEEQKRLTKRHTQDTDAYRLYLKGRHFWNKRTEEGLKKGIEYFRQAIDADPNYALAYSGLADCYNSFAFSFDLGSLPPSEAIPKAKAAAMKALEIDDTLAEAHTSLAYAKQLYDWDWSSSEREFNRALELNPNYANAHHWYSHYLIAAGRTEESLAESERALELDPLGLIINTHLGWHYIYARQYDLAVEQLRKTLELDPGYGLAHWYLGIAYEQKGLYPEAATEFRKSVEFLKGNLIVEANMGHYYAVSGQRKKAQKIIDKLQELSKQRYVSSYEIALIHLGLGEKEQAFGRLERAYQEHSDMLVYLNFEPRLDPLRGDPRFQDLLRRVGLTT
jgi:DNA-binding SARP family transcriptional activator